MDVIINNEYLYCSTMRQVLNIYYSSQILNQEKNVRTLFFPSETYEEPLVLNRVRQAFFRGRLAVGVAHGHLLARQFRWFCATLELSSYISPYA